MGGVDAVPPALPPLARLPVAAVLRDGTPAVVRAGGAPGDRDLLLAGFEQFSAASRYHRFLTVVPTLTEGMLHRLVDEVDGRDHVVVVLAPADQPDHPVGVARLIRYPHDPTIADIAVSVTDDWQGRGVATAMLRVLMPLRPVGVTRLDTEAAADNAAALAMLRRLGCTQVTVQGSGVYRVQVELGPDAPIPDSPSPPS